MQLFAVISFYKLNMMIQGIDKRYMMIQGIDKRHPRAFQTRYMGIYQPQAIAKIVQLLLINAYQTL